MNKKLSCKKCNGKGFTSVTFTVRELGTKKKEKTTWKSVCPLCNGTGKVTWIDEIIGRNTPLPKWSEICSK